MEPLPMAIVDPAQALGGDQPSPKTFGETTLQKLCEQAQISCRVTIKDPPRIRFHHGLEHYRRPGVYFVGVGASLTDRVWALRVLEILAYGFLDYGARECVCGRGLFVGQKPVGRPPVVGRPQTAAERMRAMRARRAVETV